jgi:hypothetical protein
MSHWDHFHHTEFTMQEPWNLTVVQPAVKPVFKGDAPLRRDALHRFRFRSWGSRAR